MDIPTQENQHEFFPDFVKPSDGKVAPRIPGIGRTQKPLLFTTTIEQILFASIVTILVLCAVYFLGILRGQSLAGDVPVQPVRTTPVARPRVTAQPITPAAPAAVLNNPPRMTVAATNARPIAAPTAVSAGQKRYTIQVVTHKRRAFAEGELAAISRTGFSGKILESDGYFVVCVGQYAAKNEAKKDLAFLKTRYSDCFLRRL